MLGMSSTAEPEGFNSRHALRLWTSTANLNSFQIRPNKADSVQGERKYKIRSDYSNL